MVIHPKPTAAAGGFLMIEIIVALAILALAVVPLAFSANEDSRLFRATYQKAVAMEIDFHGGRIVIELPDEIEGEENSGDTQT